MLINRPITTLFLLTSLDGKISTSNIDSRDNDKDLRRVEGVREGIQQYYDLEQKTDLVSLNTGRVMAKIGINKRKNEPKKMIVDFVIIDNKPHLKKSGLIYLSKWVKNLYLVTNNKNHPAFKLKLDNIKIIYYPGRINFDNLFIKLKKEYKINKITIQSGGMLNATLLRKKLIDKISLVIAPCLIGGSNTPTLIDGDCIRKENELLNIKALKLNSCHVLKHSYLHLTYDVIKDTNLKDN
ncbi:MAG: dihydrofolate reductase family protein [Candidatus Falkowbacteria bacterium]